MHPIFIRRHKLLILILLLLSSSFHVLNLSGKEKRKKKTIIAEDTAPYKIVQDTVVNNAVPEIHSDTIFNKKYELKRIITASETVADTSWQTNNVYSVNFRTINHYDYIPTDPAYGYTGKIKIIKPYSFFRPSEKLNIPRVAFVSGMIGGLYAGANA